jgi:electron transfer flavoprotein alpha subunit
MSHDIFVLIEHLRGTVADISYMALAQANGLTPQCGGKVKAVLLCKEPGSLAATLAADEVLCVEHPALEHFTGETYQAVLSQLIKEQQPCLILMGETSIGSDVAGGLSAKLGLPLVSMCSQIKNPDGKRVAVSQICGGKIMAETELPDETALVTLVPGKFAVEEGQRGAAPAVTKIPAPALDQLKISFKQYVEPAGEDIDITKENILIGVGRGIGNQDAMEDLKTLAEALGGVLCASRPVVDQNWLPATRLVGKSGKRINGKLYLALGISGAPEHTEAIAGCDLIIAINTDPKAPIFDIAKYGAEIDLLDLVPALAEKIQEAKGN